MSTDFFATGMGGLGANVLDTLVAAAGSAVGTVGKDVPKPLDLYNEAAPRVQRILKQYDAAAPLIDWLTENWVVAVAGSFLIGVASSYVGQLVYSRVHRK